jgi:hypothetical protein
MADSFLFLDAFYDTLFHRCQYSSNNQPKNISTENAKQRKNNNNNNNELSKDNHNDTVKVDNNPPIIQLDNNNGNE